MSVLVRPVELGDLDQLVDLCAAHAAFERSTLPAPNANRLVAALFDAPARLFAWVAVDTHRQLAGYASATIDYSTWWASDFIHLDCLYVREGMRGQSIGHRLLSAARDYALSRGLKQMQWQTPDWNIDAQRFYERFGPRRSTKVRYALDL